MNTSNNSLSLAQHLQEKLDAAVQSPHKPFPAGAGDEGSTMNDQIAAALAAASASSASTSAALEGKDTSGPGMSLAEVAAAMGNNGNSPSGSNNPGNNNMSNNMSNNDIGDGDNPNPGGNQNDSTGSAANDDDNDSSNNNNHNNNDTVASMAKSSYRDFSHVLPDKATGPSAMLAQSTTAKEPTFPVKLHLILSNPEFQEIISWLPHGRSWRILQQKAFEERVIPLYFRHGRYSSFARQVNGWGFRRVTHGSDYNSYFHEVRTIQNQRSKLHGGFGTERNKSGAPQEPETST